MLSYRHSFHAGNFADVFKHVLLVQLIRALARKDKPFCVLDTHAGAGCYDLTAPYAQRNCEFATGVARLWNATELPSELSDYREIIRSFNPTGELRSYPGSPRITRTLLRPSDRLILTELHPADHALLSAEFACDRQVTVHHTDGYTALKGFLPPPERRGLVLLDPAYERKGEFERLVDAVRQIHRRWATGIVAVWYPIQGRAPSLRFQQVLQESGIRSLLCAELGLYPYDGPPRLQGCGMILINPPWQLDACLQRLLPELLSWLHVGDGGQTRLAWLVPAP